jgi:signal transduction histidine kinase
MSRALASRALLPGQPGGFEGPFVRWPRAADAVLAAVVFLATVALEDGPGDSVVLRTLGDIPLGAIMLFALSSVALYWRRRAPFAVLGVVLIAWALLLGSDYADVGAAAIVALYSVGRYASESWWAYLGVAAAVVVVNVDGLTDSAPWGEAAFGGFVMFGSWYVGRRLRLRRERAAQLVRDQAAEAGRIVAEERTRIARELHDVVAHQVGLMTVQASAAKAVAAVDPEGALQAMGAVEEAGRQALDELRHLLGVLRPEADPGGLGPQPGLTDLPRLLDRVRSAGLDVELAMDRPVGGLPARVDLFAYRIVQEALTNVLKHAGPGARVQVWVGSERSARGESLRIEVVDGGPSSSPDVAGTPQRGHGIVGMRERALLLGGRLEAGPSDGGGFRVLALLPVGRQS